MIIVYLSFLGFLSYILAPPIINRSINIDVVNKLEYKDSDNVFIIEDCENSLVSFWMITIDGEKELFRVKSTFKKSWLKSNNLCEKINYRKYDKYIYFWFNGTINEGEEINDNGVNIQYRNKTDAIVYKYNIETAEYEKIDIKDHKKTVIIDIIKKDEKEIIIKEVATELKNKKWKEMKTVIGEFEYSFTTTNLYQEFRGSATVFDNQIILPTYKEILVLSDNNIKKRIEYPIEFPNQIELYIYKDNLVSVIASTYINIFSKDFETIDEIKVPNSFNKSMLISNKIVLYDYDIINEKIIIGYVDLDTYEFKKISETKYSKSLYEDKIKLKYNAYNNQIELYDIETGEILLDIIVN